MPRTAAAAAVPRTAERLGHVLLSIGVVPGPVLRWHEPVGAVLAGGALREVGRVIRVDRRPAAASELGLLGS